ncbi:MAG: Rieske 2Fe-2S domain-containing protein [Roseovarius sp.]|nr:Rieske 2Fe-2S domain-containing protein [Roseovarius sp.]
MKDDVKHPTGQRIPNGMLEDNFPRNMWWVAAYSSEVTTKPVPRWLLETPVVLYRLEDSTPAALYDRCPHPDGRLSRKVMSLATRSHARTTEWSSTRAGTAPRLPRNHYAQNRANPVLSGA